MNNINDKEYDLTAPKLKMDTSLLIKPFGTVQMLYFRVFYFLLLHTINVYLITFIFP